MAAVRLRIPRVPFNQVTEKNDKSASFFVICKIVNFFFIGENLVDVLWTHQPNDKRTQNIQIFDPNWMYQKLIKYTRCDNLM